jgi:hypothetical protein
MHWTTSDGTKILIKDLTNLHLSKIINMYDNIALRLPYEKGESTLEALKQANPDQADVLDALFTEYANRRTY